MNPTTRRVLWGVSAVASVWLSILAFQGPGEPVHEPTPPALVRPPSAAEKQEVHAMASELQAQIQAAQARTGRWPALNELEGNDPSGQPWLPQGLPDNPLVPGISHVADGCTDGASESTDWLYCATDGRIRPGDSPASP